MITTVTTVTTVTATAVMGIGALVSTVAVIALLALLGIHELAGSTSSGFSLRLVKYTSIGILPLIMAFTVMVVINMMDIL